MDSNQYLFIFIINFGYPLITLADLSIVDGDAHDYSSTNQYNQNSSIDSNEELTPEVEYKDLFKEAYQYQLNGDFRSAIELYNDLSNNGHKWAMFNLGEIYENGLGVPSNKIVAVEWYKKAADIGYIPAKEKLLAIQSASRNEVSPISTENSYVKKSPPIISAESEYNKPIMETKANSGADVNKNKDISDAAAFEFFFILTVILLYLAKPGFRWLINSCIKYSFYVITSPLSFIYWACSEILNYKRNGRLFDQAISIIELHRTELREYRFRGTKSLSFGRIDSGNWINKKNEFVDEVLQKSLGIIDNDLRKKIFLTIDDYTSDYENSNDDDIENMTGHDYERHINKKLKSQGWNSRVTSGSGDHGVDIVAEKNNLKLAIQCKKYQQSVDNTAVQQVYSGKNMKMYKADIAIVVTSSKNGYTAHAKKAAEDLGVLLLHDSQIDNIDLFVLHGMQQHEIQAYKQ